MITSKSPIYTKYTIFTMMLRQTKWAKLIQWCSELGLFRSIFTFKVYATIVNVDSDDCHYKLKNDKYHYHDAANYETFSDDLYLVWVVPFRVGYTWLVLSSTPATASSSIAARNLNGTNFLTNISIIS